MQAPLPVDGYIDAIVSLVRSEKRAVIVAPPGAGKTTRIPPALAAHARTILLQPRRVAARALARRIALERGWTIGDEIGWQIRFERRFRDRTQLLVATEGILTARLQADPLLSDFGVVILDEFHERSIHADLALALVRQAALSRDDLAVVVMSATMDAAAVAEFLGAKVIEIDAKRFPVEVRYAPNVTMTQAIRDVARDAKGHILCFLPGAREIERTKNELALPNVLPLHGSLDVDAQERALAPSATRKIILSTNVAETSLTVDGVTDVIDSGLQKLLHFDAETAIDHLETELISRDSADQRSGRAGRTAPGRATRLWDERMLLRAHREPEVRRVDLASAALDVIAWGGDPRTFEWFERPPEDRLESALALLTQLGAIEPRGRSAEGGARKQESSALRPLPSALFRLTPLGERLRRFPLHPRLARVLVDAHGNDLAVRVCALLSEDVRNIGGGDALVLAESPRLDHAARELARVVALAAGRPSSDGRQGTAGQRPARRIPDDDDLVRRALLAGFPDRVAMRREAGSPRFLLSSGTGAIVREPSLLAGDFLVALDISGGDEALVRIASVIERDWLTSTHRDVVHTVANGRVKAMQRVWYGALLLNEHNVAPDPDEARRLLNADLRSRVDPSLERRLAFARIDVDWDAIIATYGELQLPYDVRRRVDQLAPERLPLPSGRTTALDYRDDGAVVASVKLQELFGLAETPRVGPDRTPVTFALLSPAGRPVQVTRDLKSFWTTGYQEVRRELRARYPKHPWPEDPWTAEATHRTKRRP